MTRALMCRLRDNSFTAGLILSLLLSMPAAAARKLGPVSGRLLEIEGRHEIGAGVGVSVNDAFFRKVYLGGRYAYHLLDWLSLEGSGDYALSFAAGAIERCPPDGGACKVATTAELAATPGNIVWQAALAAQFVPLYGKLSLFAEDVLHFDLYLTAGGGGLGYKGLDRNGAATAPVVLSGVAGVGAHVYLSHSLVVRLDARNTTYKSEVRGETDWQNQPQITLSLSVLAP